jgi:hypothetical protein
MATVTMESLWHCLYLEQLRALPTALHIKCLLHKFEISSVFKMAFLRFLFKERIMLICGSHSSVTKDFSRRRCYVLSIVKYVLEIRWSVAPSPTAAINLRIKQA